MVNNNGDRSVMQAELDWLVRSAHLSNMHFNTAKGRVKNKERGPHLEDGRDYILRSSDSGKDLGVMVDHEMNRSSPAVAKWVNEIHGCLNRGLSSRNREWYYRYIQH